MWYKPINPARHEIRLLELQPGRNIDDPVVARLVVVRCNDDVEFIGLSALYGEINETEDITINGCKLPIPANIAQALRHLRAVFGREHDSSSMHHWQSSGQEPRSPLRPSAKKHQTPSWLKHLLKGFRSILPDPNSSHSHNTPLRVWIDSICINQRDEREEKERRSQIHLAYGSAKMVVGWLGLKDETTDTAVDIIRTIDGVCPPNFGEEEDRKNHPENYGPRMEWMKSIRHLWALSAEETDDPMKNPVYRATWMFVNRPYLQRQWLLDELALSRFPAFLLGNQIVSWIQILRLNRVNEEVRDHGSIYFPQVLSRLINFLPLGTVHTLLEAFDRNEDKNIRAALQKTWTMSSTASPASSGQRPTTSKSANNYY